ncbi:threonylcarbamoyl-AMP synthase [Acetobacteraceae bacterium]|nr:threonylcarbamoyl-AMP synthase [Acetobacteraceae bacterium]
MPQTHLFTAHIRDLEKAGAWLREGKLVSFPTETVYGLGGSGLLPEAIENIYKAKGRPRNNPLILHFPNLEAAFKEADPNAPLFPLAKKIAKIFWPGPLTLILRRASHSKLCNESCAGLPTFAARVPEPLSTRQILEFAGVPIAAPSANKSGRISPSSYQDVLAELDGRIDGIVAGQSCSVGIESTILDFSQEIPKILRPGKIMTNDLRPFIPNLPHYALKTHMAHPDETSQPPPIAPGQFLSHYAPTLPVKLEVSIPNPEEAWLSFKPAPDSFKGLSFALSPSGDLAEAATRLYKGLRFLDLEGQKQGLKSIAVAPIPQEGIGIAILERLFRAAAPRPSQQS